MKTAVITAIYNQYDELKPIMPQEDADVEWIYVTDDPRLANIETHLGWRVVYDLVPGHPNRAAKRPKMTPWEYADTERSIWVDGSFRVTSPSMVTEIFEYAKPIAQFVHPWRDCIYDEGEESMRLPKYAHEPIFAQMEDYGEAGHPRHWGLWAAGVIARVHTTAVVTMGVLWLNECYRWSYQDQISEPIALRQTNLRPAALPGNHFNNPWFRYEGSGRH